MKRRHSLSSHTTTPQLCPTFERCYGYHLNEATNGLRCFSAVHFIQINKQRSHSAPPDYQEIEHQKQRLSVIFYIYLDF